MKVKVAMGVCMLERVYSSGSDVCVPEAGRWLHVAHQKGLGDH